MKMPTPEDMPLRIIRLEVEMTLLKSQIEQLKEQLRRPPTAKEVREDERERMYDQLECDLDEVFDLYPGPGWEMTPTQILIALTQAGVHVSGPTDHSQKVTLARTFKRLNVVVLRDAEGRGYQIRKK